MDKECSRFFVPRSDGHAAHRKQAVMPQIPPIGEYIFEQLRVQGRSVVWLAKQLHINRSTCYRIFNNNSIDTQLLFHISLLLGVDYFAYFSKSLKEREKGIDPMELGDG